MSYSLPSLLPLCGAIRVGLISGDTRAVARSSIRSIPDADSCPQVDYLVKIFRNLLKNFDPSFGFGDEIREWLQVVSREGHLFVSFCVCSSSSETE